MEKDMEGNIGFRIYDCWYGMEYWKRHPKLVGATSIGLLTSTAKAHLVCFAGNLSDGSVLCVVYVWDNLQRIVLALLCKLGQPELGPAVAGPRSTGLFAGI